MELKYAIHVAGVQTIFAMVTMGTTSARSLSFDRICVMLLEVLETPKVFKTPEVCRVYTGSFNSNAPIRTVSRQAGQ
eukprot:scaffold134139_cov19-Tisochrysis_lutea.AAC.1